MSKITELKLKYYIYIQSKSLKRIINDSIWYMFGMLWFFVSLFALIGISGNFNPILWLIALYTIYKLLKTAINASEVGL